MREREEGREAVLCSGSGLGGEGKDEEKEGMCCQGMTTPWEADEIER